MARAPHGTLYVGVTRDTSRQVFEHREGVGSDIVRRYGVRRLVYREAFGDISDAKIKLIEEENPRWEDLYETILNWGPL